MRFLFKKFQAKRKAIVQVNIDTTTKVKFLTARDFRLYQKGKTHRYYGGTYESGSVQFVLPYDSVWHAVVEQGSYHEPIEVNASCALLLPDRDVLSTIALDAPSTVRYAIENANELLVETAQEHAENLSDGIDEIVESGDDLIGE